MPVYIEPEQFTLRGGIDAFEWPNLYTWVAQAKVQMDRSLYCYGAAGDVPPGDFALAIKEAKKLARRHKLSMVLWERKRRDGSIHVARFPVR